MIQPLPIAKAKAPGGQLIMFGIAMTKAEEACVRKINEIITVLNKK